MELNHLSQRMGKTLTEAELDKAMDAMDIDGRARGRAIQLSRDDVVPDTVLKLRHTSPMQPLGSTALPT